LMILAGLALIYAGRASWPQEKKKPPCQSCQYFLCAESDAESDVINESTAAYVQKMTPQEYREFTGDMRKMTRQEYREFRKKNPRMLIECPLPKS